MAGNSATLDLIVKLDGADKATKGLSNMAKESGGLGKAFGTLTKVGLLGATAGVGLLVGGLGLAVKAAAEEEVGIKRLGGVLKNNIKDWDGNTAAVEKDIAAKQRLGFADDQLRDSLGFLVTQTGNLTEAQNLQSTAMDLAASTGISLEKATRLVLKADDESYAALGKLGIQIDENATKEQALAAIREKTAGAAEAYSKTAAGAMEVIHNAFGDAVEDIGAVLLPKVTELMGGFADFISSPGFKEGLTSFVELLSNGIGKALEFIGPIIGTVVGEIGKFFGAITSGDPDNVKAFFNDLGGGPNSIIGIVGGTLTNVVTQAGKFFTAVTSGDKEQVKTFFNELGGGKDSIIGMVGGTLVEVVTRTTEFFKAVVSGDGKNVRAFFEELGGKDSFIAAIGGFLDEATTAALKFFAALLSNKTTLETGGRAAVHSEEWNQDKMDNGIKTTEAALNKYWTRRQEIQTAETQMVETFWTNVGTMLGTQIGKEEKGAETRNTLIAGTGAFWESFYLKQDQNLVTWGAGVNNMQLKQDALGTLVQAIWDSFFGTTKPKLDGMKTDLDNIGSAGGGGGSNTKLAWEGAFGSITPKAATFAGEVAKSGSAGQTAATTAGNAWTTFLSNVAKNTATSFFQAGANAGQGFANGIASKTVAAGNAAFALGLAAKAKLDAALRNQSPSKELYESGQWAGDGFINGMRDKIPEADRAAYDLGKTVIAALGKVAPEATTEGVKFNDSFINGMKSKLPEADVEAYNMGKQVLAALHKGVVPGLEEAGLFFREYFGSLSQNWQIAMAMMKEDTARGVADILAELARLNGTSSNGVPLNNGVPAYQQSPGGSGPPSGGGGGHGRPPQMRAWGGNITAGMPYWVGEMGRELIVPRTSGRVIPNGDLQIPERGRNYGGDLGQATTTIIIPVMLDGKKIAEVVSPHLEQRRALRNAYSI